ncbi:MAG: CHAT domain-containing protein [Jejuia sp.]
MSQFIKTGFYLLFVGFTFIMNAQDYEYPSDKAAALLGANKLLEAVTFCETSIAQELQKTSIDSIEIAFLNAYLSRAYSYQMGDANYLASIKACEDGILYCPNTEEGVLQKARMYNDKSLSEFSTNFQYRAFKSNLKALELFSSAKKPDYNYMINIYIDMSRTSVYNGNAEEAKRLLRQGERLYAEHKKSVDDQRNNSSIGRIASYEFLLPYNKIYQLTELGTSTEDSLEITKTLHKLENLIKSPNFLKGGEGLFYTASLNEVADWYISRQPEKYISKKVLNHALDLVTKAITLVEKEQYGGEGLLYVYKYNRSKMLMMLNRFEEAQLVIDDVINTTDFTSVNTPTFFAQKGRIKARQLDKDGALNNFKMAIQKIHQDKDTLKDDLSNFKPSNIFKHNEVLHTIASELIEHFPNNATVKKMVARIYKIGLLQFEASYDRRKYNKRQDLYLKRVIQGQIKTKGWGYNKDILYPNLLNHFENIKNELVWLEFYQKRKTDNLEGLETLLAEKKLLIIAVAEAQEKSNLKQQDSLQTALELTQYQIDKNYPNIDLLREHNFDVEELQQNLTNTQCILKYILLDEQLAIIKITNNEIDVQLLDWEYDKQIEALRLAAISGNTQKLKELSTLLAKVLLFNIDSKYTSLIVNPDGVLNTLPFEILIKNGRYLIEDYSIHYTSNLGFIFPKIETDITKNLLAIYTPFYPNTNQVLATRSAPVYLEGAQNEATSISNYFPSEVYKENLSKSLFKETAPNASLLHLAMHAQINPSNSGLNQLLFDNKSDSDKNLSLEEIYGMKLNANLAVLSACNTGFGNDNDGRGMESFQRAFTFASVPSTVASLWEVPDMSTKTIMVDFYKNLKKGNTKSEALQQAKINYLKGTDNPKLRHPYYWAGFVLYGDDAPVTHPSKSYLIFIFGGIAIAGLAYQYYQKKRKKVA